MTIEEMREKKREMGYSYEQIAELAGLPVGTVQKVLGGFTKSPRYATLQALQKVFTSGNPERPGLDDSQTARYPYTQESLIGDGIAEPLAEYVPEKGRGTFRLPKRQGDYTLEDYLALPDDRRVELIDGVIYDMASPTLIHQAIGGKLYAIFESYIARKHGSCMSFNAPVDVQLDCDDKTIVQPDVLIICDPSKLRRDRIYGAPDLVVEILSPSTRRKDRSLKMTKYKRAGVREYWMIDPDYRRIYVHEFEKGEAYEIYDFNDTVPVGIYGGDCVIDFAQVYEEIKILYDMT
ncbi:MAG: Uma2 family endonuclease [Lachnospiraceae bacterium]|nr:Uma2 family endonuclease [Lachnospiraceae bacterium]